MANKRQCDLCGEDLEDAPAIHDLINCEKIELTKSRVEIKNLKKSVHSWKIAWHEGRDIITKLWWHHPAIHDDNQRAYYQSMTKKN